jgi:putative flippase GtrA
MTGRTRRLLTEIARFLVVGGVATFVSFVGFNALVHGAFLGRAPLAAHPVEAFVLVNVLGGIVAYLGMRWWAFSHREVKDGTGVVSFFVLGALTMVIPVACLTISRYGLGLTSIWADNISANVIGLGLGTATRFWVFRRFVFLDVGAPVAASRGA